MNYYRVLFVTEQNNQINADVFANDLQKGWSISESTKQKHIIYDRYEYK